MDKKVTWQDDLPKFNLPFAKMLYMLYYLSSEKQIDNEQKKKLKELVLVDNKKMLQLYSVFEKNNNLNDLVSGLKKIYTEETMNKDFSKSIIHKAFESIMKRDRENEDERELAIEDLGSPTLGAFMGEEKKKKKVNDKD